MLTSRYILLRIWRQNGLPNREAASVLGIDDWAKRKGQRYGTIAVDWERHREMDLQQDHEVDTLADRLRTQLQTLGIDPYSMRRASLQVRHE